MHPLENSAMLVPAFHLGLYIKKKEQLHVCITLLTLLACSCIGTVHSSNSAEKIANLATPVTSNLSQKHTPLHMKYTL